MKVSRQRWLEVRERGASRHPLDRALLLWAEARPDVPLAELADLPIGERDADLLALRCANFGRSLPAYIDCPACGTRLEFVLDALALHQSTQPSGCGAGIEMDGRLIRLPTSRALAQALAQPDEAAAVRCLAAHCLNDGPALPEPAAIEAVEKALEQLDGAADIVLDLQCEQCAHPWQSPFDIAGFLWLEIDAQARCLLHDVHLLAHAYGWSEAEVLALSDARRAAYVEMVLS